MAAARGITVGLPQAGGGAGGGVVDSAALNELSSQILGEEGLLAQSARKLLESLGLEGVQLLPEGTPVEDEDAILAARTFDAVSAELGTGWVEQVKPVFAPEKAVLLDDRWASAREDLARLWLDPTSTASERIEFWGAGKAVAEQANWWRQRATAASRDDLAATYARIADEAVGQSPEGAARAASATRFADDVALVTGVTPTSIAGAVVADLLAGGATVIATSSRVDASRLAFAKRLYRENAAPGARLWLVPANLSSYRDVDALIDWVGSEQTRVVGPKTTVLKPALVPTLFLPFAAPSVMGSLADAGEKTEAQTRLLLWSVERSIAKLAALAAASSNDTKVHVILPGRI